MPSEKRQRQKAGTQARRQAALEAAKRNQRKRRTIQFAVLVVAAFALIFVLAAVGGDDKKDSAADSSDKTTTTETTTTEPTPPTSAKPTVEVPKEPAPTELVIKDLKEGEGPEVKVGDSIQVNYVGVTYADGKQFDSSWDNGSPATFDLVEGGLIEGWVKGIPGMKAGGRRELIIPGSMAYGDEDTGDGRPHGALLFIVDLVAIK